MTEELKYFIKNYDNTNIFYILCMTPFSLNELGDIAVMD